jgi:hypothetical protein
MAWVTEIHGVDTTVSNLVIVSSNDITAVRAVRFFVHVALESATKRVHGELPEAALKSELLRY